MPNYQTYREPSRSATPDADVVVPLLQAVTTGIMGAALDLLLRRAALRETDPQNREELNQMRDKLRTVLAVDA